MYSFSLVRCPLLAEGFPSARYFIDTLIRFIHSFIHFLYLRVKAQLNTIL